MGLNEFVRGLLTYICLQVKPKVDISSRWRPYLDERLPFSWYKLRKTFFRIRLYFPSKNTALNFKNGNCSIKIIAFQNILLEFLSSYTKMKKFWTKDLKLGQIQDWDPPPKQYSTTFLRNSPFTIYVWNVKNKQQIFTFCVCNYSLLL